MSKKILVGMSGGVDSSVAALLLKKEGYAVTGVFMNVRGDTAHPVNASLKSACCGHEGKDLEDAQKIAGILGIKLHIIDLSKEYGKTVLKYFTGEYTAGRTPNPCVICNRFLKFGILRDRAEKAAGATFDYFATGHYVRAEYDKTLRRHVLKKGADPEKDQSYFLFLLTQEQISHTLFPLGRHTKKQVRALAKEYGLPVSDKEESQDFACGDRLFLFEGACGEGPVIDQDGRVLGRHKGIFNYTIGQRKGMGIAAKHPLYVTGIDKKTNSITVGEKKDVYGKELIAGDVNLVGIDSISKPLKVYAKIRYKHPAAPATVEPFDAKQPPQPAPSPPGEKEKETTKFPLPFGERDRVRGEKGKILVRFEKPQWAITPGQAVVFYRKNLLLGGGFIKKRL